VVELELSKVLEWRSRTPDDTLRPCARFQGLVRWCGKVVHSGDFEVFGVLCWRVRNVHLGSRFAIRFEYDLVLPIGEQNEIKCAISEGQRYGDLSVFAFLERYE
jgi:hypothetical protein